MEKINFTVKDVKGANFGINDVVVKKVYPPLVDETVIPTKEQQVLTHEGEYGYDTVTVEPIPDEYIIPEGTLPITENTTYDVTRFKRVSANVKPAPELQDKEATPTKETQNVTFDSGFDGLHTVTIKPIPNNYIEPTGTKEIKTEGTHDVTEYASVDVDVEPTLQDKQVTPTKQTQTITSDVGYDGLNNVVVNPIPNEYVIPNGTLDITENGTQDVTNYAEVNVNIESSSGGSDLSEYFTETIGGGSTISYNDWYDAFIKFPPLPLATNHMKGMYLNCKVQAIDLNGAKGRTVTNMSSTFSGCSEVTSLDLSDIVLEVTDWSSCFNNCSKLQSINFGDYDLSHATYFTGVFTGCTVLEEIIWGNVNMPNNTRLSQIFYNCKGIKTLNIKNMCGSLVTTLSRAFQECNILETLDVSEWDTSNVSVMEYCFFNCYKLANVNLNSWTTEKVTTFQRMFYGCKTLTELNLSHWVNTIASSMAYMFHNCTQLKRINLSSIANTNTVDISYMFNSCTSLEKIDMRSFDFTKCTSYSNMLNKVPTTCEIIVKDDTQKDWFASKFATYTNVKTVAEL